MTYVISDIHGCYGKYIKMLEKIGFSDGDTLYVLGDVIDRGQDGIRILQDMTERKNVIPILGNHEYTALPVFRLITKYSALSDRAIGPAYNAMWMASGGEPTKTAFLELSDEERKKVLKYVESFTVFDEVTVGKKTFHLSHTLPYYDPERDIHDVSVFDFVWGEPDYEKRYDPEKIFITGHTPTGFIDPAYKGRIWRKNGHIAIDCGAVFGNPLGCICLETLEEIYTED